MKTRNSVAAVVCMVPLFTQTSAEHVCLGIRRRTSYHTQKRLFDFSNVKTVPCNCLEYVMRFQLVLLMYGNVLNVLAASKENPLDTLLQGISS